MRPRAPLIASLLRLTIVAVSLTSLLTLGSCASSSVSEEESPSEEGGYILEEEGDFEYSDNSDWSGLKITGSKVDKGLIRAIVIPDTIEGLPVLEIDAWAFAECPILESLTLGANVEDIGTSAFAACPKLVVKQWSIGLRHIGNWSFENCTSLESLKLPLNVESIGDAAFYACCALEEVSLPIGIKSIGEEAFAYCTKLRSINLPSTIEKIDNRAFEACPIARVE